MEGLTLSYLFFSFLQKGGSIFEKEHVLLTRQTPLT